MSPNPSDRLATDTGWRLELLAQRQTFRDVVVMPTESIHKDSMFTGGPVWPYYPLQVRARYSKGLVPLPRDRRPRCSDPPTTTIATATWCGPIIHHFGHAVADFGTRLAASGAADPTQPLLFSLNTRSKRRPPSYFWDLLDHFGIDRSRVILLREPALVRELHVFPQGERRGSLRTSGRYLDLLDRITGRTVDADRYPLVYVSRSRLRGDNPSPQSNLIGEIGGERYLEEALAGIGAKIVHPESLALQEQLDVYRRADRLVFAEGSALHGLQLLGRLDADIVVINRRRFKRVAAGALRPRSRSLTYIDAVRGEIYGLDATGRHDRVRAICVLDPARLTKSLSRAGIDLRATWDSAAYERQRDADIAGWRKATLAKADHAGTDATIAACLRRLSLTLGPWPPA
ncbi:glycosyltransferase 61 family protein [Methylobacterium sp. 77]|uniref:glycosyltransferase 61 family protein n=1 Tax=Methylobacterium sp. 77 TaxID=1101192 RepID=UPI000380672E|nr:glycosyltransferase 61 family protein [Methylobacterium sp. 77]